MKHLICVLSLLALIASAAFAQESETVESRHKRFQELAGKLASEDPAEVAAALEELRKLGGKMLDPRPPIRVSTQEGEGELHFEVDAYAGKEKIRGTWSNDGTKGQYTLTSKGKGRYELLARSVDPQGSESKYTDEGSLEELRKKYPFLRRFRAVFIGPGGIETSISGTNWNPIGVWPHRTFVKPTTTTAIPTLGITVRRPSKELEFHLKLPTETTWIVESVTSGGKGASLGLKRYDLVTEADGDDLTEIAPLQKASKTIAIVRRSKPMRLALQPTDKK